MLDDVSEQRETQLALVQAEKLTVMGRFAATMAHEINNPLQAVIGCLGLAREALAASEPDAGRFLDVAADELRRAAGIVARMRDINRPPDMAQREPNDLNALLERVLALTEKKARSQRVAVSLQAGSDLPPVPLVSDRIHQVFLNLVLNAIEAMPDGGSLRVRTEVIEDPPGVLVSFADTGPGIPPDVRARLFAPFYTTKSEGVGLGLYISHTIVREHGGDIEVESEVGNGATFTVRLPL
jgi:signal transduction histidine kinase